MNYKELISKNKKLENERINERKNIRNANNKTEAEFLKEYRPGDYPRPSVAVDNLIFTIDNNELKVLLIKRKDHPYIDTWALPGGFVDCGKNGETAEQAAYRELKEETNLENIYMEQLYTWSAVDRDPRMRVMSVSFMALINKDGQTLRAGDDAKDAAWFSVSKVFDETDKDGIIHYTLKLSNEEKKIEVTADVFDIPRQNGVLDSYKSEIIQTSKDALAYDHINIINMGIDRLRNKIEYTPIAFNLVPIEFTLPQLQKIYEIVLEKKLYKKNFRDKVADMVVSVNKVDDGHTGPKAQMYKYKGRYY